MFEAKDSYELRIIPFKSVNELSFGIQRQEMWNKLENPKTSFMKASFSKTETDDYEKFHIYYDTNYNFEAIEIFGDIDVYYNDEKLSKCTLRH